MGKKEYLGITQDGDLLKIARVRREKHRWIVSQLDRVTIKEGKDLNRRKNRSKEKVKEYDEDFHFGLEKHYGEKDSTNGDLDLLLAVEENGNGHDVFNSNVITLKNALEEVDSKKLKIGITVRSGDTNYQVLKDKDYNQLKKKELEKYIEDQLKKAYGAVPNTDYYNYEIREDGSLLVISYKEKPYLLKLLDSARHLYSNKIKIRQMIPDESVLASLIQRNYKLDKEGITCVIHMSFNTSRVFFMRGNQIEYAISPIEEGRSSEGALDVIFSKILFQLDTGELSGLDRILITNNDLNEKSINYFRKQFPDIEVDEFRFNTSEVEVPDRLEAVGGFFTSAIGAALSAAEIKDPVFSKYSMLPSYIQERQNVLKLKWHGVLLLLLLLATPVFWNFQYQNKHKQINDLNEELYRTNIRIRDLQPIVIRSNTVQQLYQVEQNKMDLLAQLGDGVYYWSNTLKMLNDGLGNIKHVWIDRVKYVENGFILQGYSMTRDRIPKVTNLFKWAELKAVSVVEMRDIKLYKFSIQVYHNFKDDLDSKFSKSGIVQNNK